MPITNAEFDDIRMKVGHGLLTFHDALDQIQAKIAGAAQAQKNNVYAAVSLLKGETNPPIDSDAKTAALTAADMANAPTGIMPGDPNGVNVLATALGTAPAATQEALAVAGAAAAQTDGGALDPERTEAVASLSTAMAAADKATLENLHLLEAEAAKADVIDVPPKAIPPLPKKEAD